MKDPVETAAAVMQKAEALLVEVHQTRARLADAPATPERATYLAMLESFDRGLLAAFAGVVAELKTQCADISPRPERVPAGVPRGSGILLAPAAPFP